MFFYIPHDVIVKAQTAYKNAPLPGTDAMAYALRTIRDELWDLVVDEYEFQNELKEIQE